MIMADAMVLPTSVPIPVINSFISLGTRMTDLTDVTDFFKIYFSFSVVYK
jgi:hypothetical protein